MYKYANCLKSPPPVMNSLYTVNSDIHEHNMRQNISYIWNALQKIMRCKHMSKSSRLNFQLMFFKLKMKYLVLFMFNFIIYVYVKCASISHCVLYMKILTYLSIHFLSCIANMRVKSVNCVSMFQCITVAYNKYFAFDYVM